MSGIYLHIPFCKQKCTYCDFHFSTSFQGYRQAMIETMRDELLLRKDYLVEKQLNSVYFGGGTPSLLNEEEFDLLFQVIKTHFTLSAETEITIEANPDDITVENLEIWKNIGFNRLSIGLQSFKEEDLKWMNRAHTVSEAQNCVELAQKNGFTNISVDLIYGLPDLSQEEWANHIENVLQMNVQHVSAYCLTVEEKTVLHHLVETKKINPVGEDAQSEHFLYLSKRLKEAGYLHYEISNFGLPGYEAVHNSNYWRGKSYLGIGPSAHSFNGTSRQWSVANNSTYIKNFAVNEEWFEMEILTPKERWSELVMTGLRTSFGVDLDQLAAISPISKSFQDKVTLFTANGWVLRDSNKLFLSDEGRLKADYIASELFID
jgi:oxygen-independent coproporphyrinogen-3 oxidase